MKLALKPQRQGPLRDPPPSVPDSSSPTKPVTGVETSPDPFDPARLALKGNPAEAVGVKKVLAHVQVRKPNRQEFVRVYPGSSFRIAMAIVELQEEREIYGVIPEVALELLGETKIVMLTTCINRQGSLFLWPVPLPSSDGREIAWHKTAREAATRADTVWVRLVSNRSLGAYDIYDATGPSVSRSWPDYKLQDLLRVAFGNGRLIESLDHPVVRRLQGRA